MINAETAAAMAQVIREEHEKCRLEVGVPENLAYVLKHINVCVSKGLNEVYYDLHIEPENIDVLKGLGFNIIESYADYKSKYYKLSW